MTVLSSSDARPGTIHAIPVRRPGRMVAVVVVIAVTALLLWQIATNGAFDWPFTFQAMSQNVVIQGFIFGTLLITVGSMIVGVVLGIALAVMRMSENPVLRIVAGGYIWFFRAIPRYVLLAILGGAGVFFAGGMFGPIDVNALSSTAWMGIIGLGLSEAAYMAEIARSGIISVDKGQREAAQALGMNGGQTMRRIVLPQAMRVIVPPTGNETIAMFKDTSLLSAVPIANELYFQLHSIGATYYKMIPALMGATLYYLITATILGFGQSYLERHFGRGYASSDSQGRRKARADANTLGETPLMFPGSDH